MVKAKMVTVMRWYAQGEVKQEDSEQNEVDGMKKGDQELILQVRWCIAYLKEQFVTITIWMVELECQPTRSEF